MIQHKLLVSLLAVSYLAGACGSDAARVDSSGASPTADPEGEVTQSPPGATESTPRPAPSGSGWRVIATRVTGHWNPMGEELDVHTLEVTLGDRVDTIVDVVQTDQISGDDSTLVGVAVGRADASGAERQIFVYSAVSGRTMRAPVPGDVLYNFTDLAVSSDGRYLAYVANVTTPEYGNRAVIFDMSARRTIYAGPLAKQCDCDVDMNHARWITSDSVEFALDNTNGGDGPGWQRIRARMAPVRAIMDTLAKEPDFHVSRP